MAEAIELERWVTLHYELKDSRGNLLAKTEEPVEFVYGLGSVPQTLEPALGALEGAAAGDVFTLTLSPEEAFGTRDESNVYQVPREEFPDGAELEPGAEFEAETDEGSVMLVHVVEVHDEHALVYANHPLAGETLNYVLRVVSVREATADELLAAKMEGSELAPSGDPS